MNPINLTIKGINSFEEEQFIDFAKLSANGLFGIFGPTGSGKSTILDAMTLALYGKIPRYTHAGERSATFINVNVQTAAVRFEFALMKEGNTANYVAERSFKRTAAKTDAAGRTAAAGYKTITTRLFKKSSTESGVEVIEDRRNDLVNKAVEELIGLSYDDFVRSVVLPQGNFSEFLLLRNTERRNMLERIFNLGEYGEQLYKRINGYRYNVESEVKSTTAAIETYKDCSEEVLKQEKNKQQEQILFINEMAEKQNQLNCELAELRRLNHFAAEYLETKQNIDVLNGRRDEIQSMEQSFQLSRRAESLVGMISELEAVEQNTAESEQKLIAGRTRREQLAQTLAKITTEYTEAARAKDELPRLSAELEKLNQCLSIIADIERLEAERRLLLGEYQDNNRTMKSKQQKLESYDKELEQIRQQTAEIAVQNEKIAIATEIRTLIDEGVAEEQTIADLNAELRAEQQKITAQQDNITSVAEEITESLRQQNAAQTEIDIEKKILISLQNEFEEERQGCIEAAEKLRVGLNERLMSKQAQKQEQDAQIKELEQRNAAHILAQSLSEGEPCPVCGSVHHPASTQTNTEDIAAAIVAREQLHQEIEELHTQLLAVSQEISADRRARYDRDVLARQSKINTLGQNIQGILLKKARNEERNAQSEAQLEQSKLRLQQLNDKLDEGNRRLVALSERASVSETFEAVRNTLRKNDELREQLESQRITLTRRMDEINEKRSNAAAEIAALNSELNATLAIGKEKKASIENSSKRLMELGGIESADDIVPRIAVIDQQLSEIKQREAELAERKNEAERAVQELERHVAGLERETAQLNGLAQSQGAKLRDMMGEFTDRAQVKAAYLGAEQRHLLEGEINAFHQQRNTAVARNEKALAGLAGKDAVIVATELNAAEEKHAATNRQMEEMRNEYAVAAERIRVMEKRLKQLEELQDKHQELTKKFDYADMLSKLFKGNRFVEFIALRHLKYITVEASQRLKRMTSGRYALELSDADFVIRDDFNGGARRPPSALSGGELFMTSLCLALALSAQIQMKNSSDLSFFFLDEGFGSLDASLLETVMDVLEQLKNEKMTVGLISHVDALKARVDSYITVVPGDISSGSSVRQA